MLCSTSCFGTSWLRTDHLRRNFKCFPNILIAQAYLNTLKSLLTRTKVFFFSFMGVSVLFNIEAGSKINDALQTHKTQNERKINLTLLSFKYQVKSINYDFYEAKCTRKWF